MIRELASRPLILASVDWPDMLGRAAETEDSDATEASLASV